MDIDTKAKILTKAIAMQENGGKIPTNPVAGQSGEMKSIFQFVPSTWKGYAKEVFGDENTPLTNDNEVTVMYSKIKKQLENGYTPAQIASMHNAGEDDPDAYTGTFNSTKKSSIGKNDYGVDYNVPDYVKGVEKYATQLMNKQSPGALDSVGGTLKDLAIGFANGVNTNLVDPLQSALGLKTATQSGQDIGINYDPNNKIQSGANTAGTYAPAVTAGLGALAAGGGLLSGLVKNVAGDVVKGALGMEDLNSVKDLITKYLLNGTAMGEQLSNSLDKYIKTKEQAQSIQDLMTSASQEQLDDIRKRLSVSPETTVKELISDPWKYAKEIQETIKKSEETKKVPAKLPELSKSKTTLKKTK